MHFGHFRNPEDFTSSGIAMAHKYFRNSILGSLTGPRFKADAKEKQEWGLLHKSE